MYYLGKVGVWQYEQRFLVFGGRNQSGATDRIYTLGSLEFGENEETLPVRLYGHCVVTDPRSSKTYIIGGYHGRVDENSGISSDVWLMDYSKLPPETVLLNSLKTPRMEHMCELLETPDGWKIIVAGGFDGMNSLDSIEIFDIRNNTDYNQWNSSDSSLNQPIHGGAMVSKSTELKIIGGKSLGRGFSNKVTTLSWNSTKKDVDVNDDENTLNYARADFVVIDTTISFCGGTPKPPTDPTTTEMTTEAPTDAPTEALTEATDPTMEATTGLCPGPLCP